MLSYQGKVVSVDKQDKIDMADIADSEGEDLDDLLDEHHHSEFESTSDETQESLASDIS